MKKYYFMIFAFFLLVMIITPCLCFISDKDKNDIIIEENNSQINNDKTSEISQENQSIIENKNQEVSNTTSNNFFLLFDESKNENISVSFYDYMLYSTMSEVPPSYHSEAIKAQAVAGFSYALRQHLLAEDKNNPLFNVNSEKLSGYTTLETLKTRWGGKFDEYFKKFEIAIKDVVNQAVVFEGKPILAAYHAISTGFTENSETVWGQQLPYLKAVEVKGDLLAENYENNKEISFSECETALKTFSSDISLPENKMEWFKNIEKNSSLTVTKISVGNKSFNGQEIRKIFDLKSASFDVEVEKNSFIFKTKGYGHCVGMSQNGADFLARQGNDYKNILKTFYQGCEIEVQKL